MNKREEILEEIEEIIFDMEEITQGVMYFEDELLLEQKRLELADLEYELSKN